MRNSSAYPMAPAAPVTVTFTGVEGMDRSVFLSTGRTLTRAATG